MAKKPRVHNEWFTPVSYGGRKSCITCGAKFSVGEQQWTWGEYVRGQWRTVARFCKHCFAEEVQKPLFAHIKPCGCVVQLVGKQCTLPGWLTLEGDTK